MAVLRALTGPNPGQIFPLESEVTVLGRHPDCDIVLEVGAVSREHTQIVKVDANYYVEDLKSRNGTFVNEELVEGRQKLLENDQLRICDREFAFRSGSPEMTIVSSQSSETCDITALMMDDAIIGSGSTITSKVDISSGSSGLRLAVNAEAKLKAVLEIGQNLGNAVGLSAVLPKLLDNLFAIFIQADRGFIALRKPDMEQLVLEAVKHRREDSTEGIRISRTIVNGVIKGKEAILSADAATDSRFDMSESIVDFHIHSMMCAPLIGSEGNVLGVLQIDTLDQRHHFVEEDLEVLASIACQAAMVVENAQLHEIALHEEGLKRELSLAHKVQRGFLPASPPEVEGYEFFDFYDPAKYLGGDYFDYVQLSGGRLAVVLADVSGKGVSAALLMAKLSAETRVSLVREATPVAAIRRINEVFCESRWDDRFITMVAVVLDPQRHEVGIVNAGHMAPLVRHVDGSIDAVGQSVNGLPLGVDCDAEYEVYLTTLAPGDLLTMYTDGISDAQNVAEEFYGTQRLEAQLATPSIDGVAALGRQILDDVKRFVGRQPQTDDMCLTCFGRVRSGSEAGVEGLGLRD